MTIKSERHIIRGMQRDLSVSKFNPEFAFECKNIRITARENNTLLSVTNEKGNLELPLKTLTGSPFTIDGTLLGYNVLNQYVTIFTKGVSDNIYRLEEKGDYIEVKQLFSGNLNFNTNNPIESIGVYENDEIQKVYWVDGLNQSRVINIVAEDSIVESYTSNSFDFVQRLVLKEDISITRDDVANGSFASGVIQYAFSYYNKYGQESNIFYTSPLQYISFFNRGASPEDKVSNSFVISIKNADTNFDYIRIYSIHRTSIDGTPTVLNVTDLAVNSEEIIYVDNGTTGSTVDPAELLYIGGEEVVFRTMAQKDNTLFLGNADIKRELIDQETIDLIRTDKSPQFLNKDLQETVNPSGFYPYKNSLHLGATTTTFKYLETYRFGIQFQYKTGKWSEPIWIKDVENTVQPYTTSVSQQPKPVKASYRITPDIISKVVSKGFVRARGVVVYPTLTDRSVIAQGILCPTVYNVGDRHGNSPFSQASWFARPNAPYDYDKAQIYQRIEAGKYNSDWYDKSNPLEYSINSRWGTWNDATVLVNIYNSAGTVTETLTMDPVNMGAWMEFRHAFPLPGNNSRSGEIQCLMNVPQTESPVANTQAELNKWVGDHQEYYFVDQSIVTMHSPDIEFDEGIQSIDSSNLKLRIVGMVPLTSFASNIDIQTSTPPANIGMQGFYKEPMQADNLSKFGFRGLVAGAFWFDDLSRYKESNQNPNQYTTGFVVYPWHRNGSLNNFGLPNSEQPTRPAMLDKKKISTLRYSYTSVYLAQNKIWEAQVSGSTTKTGISGVNIWNSNEQSVIRIPAPKYSGLNDLNYYGNIDKVLSISRVGDKKQGYPIMTTGVQNADQNAHLLFGGSFTTINQDYTDDIYGTEPVRIKYKSTPHAVMALNFSTTGKSQNILPTLKDGDPAVGPSELWTINSRNGSTRVPFWRWDPDVTNNVVTYQDALESPVEGGIYEQGLGYGWFWLGELYNDNIQNRFGGDTEEALENNMWLPAGEPELLVSYDSSGNPTPLTTYVDISYDQGDTFLQRYDCLKTYPYTLEDQNSVVDIVSFLCETRVNIDGRYDKNRGQINNLVMTPTNFNLLNPVYGQKNTFFNYRGVNHSRFNLNRFPNVVTWTKEKQLGSLIDAWTSITMASTLDMDGDKGEVVSLNTFNNEIFCFQRQGLSNILFNSRVQIPTSDGLPIEITNGLKVSGKRYISNTIGCSNKWSIVESPSGLYFIDNETNSLYLFNGQISSLSDKLGLRQWISDNNSHIDWDPVNYGNFRGFYDKNNNDVYFVNKNWCLCYSELIGQFTSFLSYEKVPAMFNIRSEFYAFNNSKIWKQFAGPYNYFFNTFQPYYITVVANAEEPLDKIFNTIEFRADAWDGTNLVPTKTYDTLDVYNEYQHGKTSLDSIIGRPTSLKRKFRIWRATIPRANTTINGINGNNRDRIRNTWAYVKLSTNNPNTYRTEFHDLSVYYFT